MWLKVMICMKTSPKGFTASKCDVGNWIFSKSWEFFGIFLGILWECFWNSLGMFWEFFGNPLGILQEFFGDTFGILWEFFREFFGNSLGNSLGILYKFFGNSFVCQDFGFFQDFVSMEKKEGYFNPQKCERHLIALKKLFLTQQYSLFSIYQKHLKFQILTKLSVIGSKKFWKYEKK